MKITQVHPWNVSPPEAKRIQQELRGRVVEENRFGEIHTVAGIDVGVKEDDIIRAAVVVLRFPELTPLDQSVAEMPATFPYIPGLLAFREVPVVSSALEKLAKEPDLLIVDGQGRAHPRRMGIACHVGLITDRPTIGCAKSWLYGRYEMPDTPAGSYAYLYGDDDEIVGAVVRSKDHVSPLFVSIGHRIDLPTAIDLVLKCTRGYRLPETTRYAHRVAGGEKVQIQPAQGSLF